MLASVGGRTAPVRRYWRIFAGSKVLPTSAGALACGTWHWV
jgi:hypothetical protein